ncbi:MAG: hypothetical protein ACOY4R_10350 [Pseudomonadota bacterium]
MSGPGGDSPSLLGALAKVVAVYGAIAAESAGRRIARQLAGYLVVAALLVTSLCFLTVAGYRALSLALGDIYASLVAGCVFLFVALVAALIVQARSR